MVRGANAGRIGFGIGDEFSDSRGQERGTDLHHQWHAHDLGDRRDIADEVEIELLIKRGVDRLEEPASSSVSPSGGAFTTASALMLPPAPGRFSMTTD